MKKYSLMRNVARDRASLWIAVLLVLITGLGGWLRFYQIGKLSFWLDEAYSAIQAEGGLVHALRSDPNMSLFNVVAHVWVRTMPAASDGALRSIAAVFSILSIPVVYLLGRSLVTDRKKAVSIGLIAALLVAIHAFQVQFAQEFRAYSLVTLLTALSTLLLVKTVDDPGTRWIWPLGYTLVTAASVYAHFLVGFMIIAQWMALAFFLFDRRKYAGVLRRMLFCGLGLGFLLIPAVVVVFYKGSEQISWISPPTMEMVRDFLVEISGKQGLWSALLYFALAGLGLLLGLGTWSQQDFITRWKFTLVASCLFLPAGLGLAISKWVLPIFMPRYFLFITPYLAVLAAAGITATFGASLQAGKSRWITLPLGMCALICLILLSAEGLRTYYREYQKEDWRAASQFMAAHCSEALRLYYPPFMEISAIYYDPGLLSQEEGWWRNLVDGGNAPEGITASFPQGYETVCLGLRFVGVTQTDPLAADIRAAILEQFPNEASARFYQAEVVVFSKEPMQ